MEKLLCESLDEFRLMEAEGEKRGMVGGLVHAVKTYPGRVLRTARTKAIIQKYKVKLINKINVIPPKYVPTLNKLIQKTQVRLDAINPGESDERQRNMKQDILDDMEAYMKGILDKLKGAMDNQLKVYDDALHARLDRAGTLTGVEFYPEEKTALLSQWQGVQDQITDHIQQKIVELMDNPFISQYQEIKAELEEYIKNKDPWHSTYADDGNDDESKVSGVQKQILEAIKNDGFELKKPYKVIQPANFDPPKPTTSNYVMFALDKNYYVYYVYANLATGKYKMIPGTKAYFTQLGETGREWVHRQFKICNGGIAKPAVAPTP